MRTQQLAYGTPQHGKAFTDAAEEIRRLLHQFAAGFLKEPNPGVIQAMLALRNLEIPQRADLPEDDFLDDEFADLPLDSQPAAEVELPAEPMPSQRRAERDAVLRRRQAVTPAPALRMRLCVDPHNH